MKIITLTILLGVGIVLSSHAQGTFILWNDTALTRLGSIDGSFAGPGIWGQALGGFTIDSLTPLGAPVEHRAGGLLSFGPTIFVPWADVGERIYVQMVVWDSTIWGTSLASVPTGQLGRTDTVPVFLSSPTASPLLTVFAQSAVVPVPEPSAFALIGLGGLAWALLRRRN